MSPSISYLRVVNNAHTPTLDLAPSFITHRELDLALGGGQRGARQRQRLHDRGALPDPCWVRSDRDKVAIYPEFVVVGLLHGVYKQPSGVEALHEVASWSERLFETSAFMAMMTAATDALSAVRQAWNLEVFIELLLKEERDAYDEFSGLVASYENKLLDFGFEFDRQYGCVHEIRPDAYVIWKHGARASEQTIVKETALAPFERGSYLAIEEVRGLGLARQFLMPLIGEPDSPISTEMAPETMDDLWTDVPEAAWDEMLMRAQASAAGFSFDDDYWTEPAPVGVDFPLELAEIDRGAVTD
jgi:hypothetical protein